MTAGALILLQLFGCDAFHKAFSSVNGLTEGTVVQGAVLGVEVPDDPAIQALIEGTDFAPGTGITAFVADATSIADLANAPVDDAIVTMNGNVAEIVPPQANGLYASDPTGSDLEYQDDADWELDVNREGAVGSAFVHLPPAAAFDVEQVHDKNTPLTIDLAGQGFQSTVAVVIDQNGEVTWNNVPTDIKALYDAMQGEDAGVLTIPGSAFASDGVYAVGVAAMVHTSAEDLEGMNTVLSKVRSGKMVLRPVSTVPLPGQ